MYSKEELERRRNALLEEQQKRHPTLTLREMKKILGIASESTVKHMLDRMIEMGMAEPESRGKTKTVYRILP